MTPLPGILFSPWLLFSGQVIVGCSSATAHIGNILQPLPSPDVLGVWGYCGSRYGLSEAGVLEAFDCVDGLVITAGETITVGIRDGPRLLCDRVTAKIWVSPFLNKPDLPDQGSFTFTTSDVQNFTMRGSLSCCDENKAPKCSGWGIISEVPGRNDVLVSINNADRPEPVPCNAVDGCKG